MRDWRSLICTWTVANAVPPKTTPQKPDRREVAGVTVQELQNTQLSDCPFFNPVSDLLATKTCTNNSALFRLLQLLNSCYTYIFPRMTELSVSLHRFSMCCLLIIWEANFQPFGSRCQVANRATSCLEIAAKRVGYEPC
jgi:hypothetical protein